jgi:hypothetical protein
VIIMKGIIIDIGRTLGKAVIAGVGLELARLASLALRRRLDPSEEDEAKKKSDEKKAATPEELRAENEKLKAELEKLRSELATQRDGSGTLI